MVSITPAMLHYGVLPYEHYESASKSKDTTATTKIMGKTLTEFADEMLNTIAQKEKKNFLNVHILTLQNFILMIIISIVLP